MTAAPKPVQVALGWYNEELMALDTLSMSDAEKREAWSGTGWLTARRECNAMRRLEEIKNFADIKPFWSRQATIEGHLLDNHIKLADKSIPARAASE